MSRVLLDAGVIVALLRPADAWHRWSREAVAAIKPPLYTCEPVLAEASYLLRKVPGAAVGVLDLVARGFVEVTFRLDTDVLPVRNLMARYRSVPMSLADACLVRMAELDPKAAVLTVDSNFRVYRRGGRLVIPVIMPS